MKKPFDSNTRYIELYILWTNKLDPELKIAINLIDIILAFRMTYRTDITK